MHNKGAVWAIHRDSSNSSWVKGKVITLLIAFCSSPPPVNSGLVSTTKYAFWLVFALKPPQQLFAAGLPLSGCFAGGGCSAAKGAEQHPCTSATYIHHVAAHRKLVVEVAFWAITIMPTQWPVPGLCSSSWSQRDPVTNATVFLLGPHSCLYFLSGSLVFALAVDKGCVARDLGTSQNETHFPGPPLQDSAPGGSSCTGEVGW